MALSAVSEAKALYRAEPWTRQVYSAAWLTTPPKNGDVVQLGDGLAGVVAQLSFYPNNGIFTIRVVGEYDVITEAGQTYTDGCQVYWDTALLKAVDSMPVAGFAIGTYRAVTAEPSYTAATTRIRVLLNGVIALELAGNELSFTGVSTANKIVVPDNLADALSIENADGSDVLVITTTNAGDRVTITPAVTITGAITSAGGISLTGGSDIAFAGSTGQNEITLTDNLADALSIKILAGADIMVVCTTNNAESLTITPATTITGKATLNGGFSVSHTVTPVAAAGSTVADAGQLGSTMVVHISSDGATKGVKLPTGVKDDMVIIINDSGTAAELYAASGGTVNGLAANASVVIPASKGVMCFCTAADTWKIFDLPAAASAS